MTLQKRLADIVGGANVLTEAADMKPYTVDWRKQYAGWKALEKLVFVDRLMASIAGKPPARPTGRQDYRITSIRTTLKRYYPEPGGRIRLQPANAQLEPLVVDEVEIRGVVIGVVRRY